VLSQTFPNRFYLLSGTSAGHTNNAFPTDPRDYAWPTVFDRLDAAGVTWRVYFNEVPFAFLFASARNHAAGHVFPISQYYADAAAGQLPSVSFVDPVFVGTNNTENDEHPPTNVQGGQLNTANVINALFTSPNWPDSALFLTYDEHGGYYDHLPPPTAVLPDAIAPDAKPVPGAKAYAFDHLGIRVPFVVVSPWAKQHYNSSALIDPITNARSLDLTNPTDPKYGNPARVYSHTSILRTIEERFGLTGLTARDAASNDLADLFDFSAMHFEHPPQLAAATVDPAQAAECQLRQGVPGGI
jgi:phospholipase C